MGKSLFSAVFHARISMWVIVNEHSVLFQLVEICPFQVEDLKRNTTVELFFVEASSSFEQIL